MIDKNIAEIDDADTDDIPVARQITEHLERALIQRAEGPTFEPAIGAGGEFVAAEPHAPMLSRRLGGGQRG